MDPSAGFQRKSVTVAGWFDNKDEKKEEKKDGGVMEIMTGDSFNNPIPEELREEIYRAEANTEAAKKRDQRILLYGICTVFFIGIAFFNGFLTELRRPIDETDIAGFVQQGYEAPPIYSELNLDQIGFSWVNSNILFQFLFTNKIGGFLALVSGGIFGTIAELDVRSKQENAEKIWKEMERRKNQKESKPKSKQQASKSTQLKKKKRTKQNKRLEALSEVLTEEAPAIVEEEQVAVEPATPVKEEEEGGIIGKMKGFYKQADNMAASQALLMNKKLEEQGIVEKITDETGLKVIGKEAAAKLAEKDKTTDGQLQDDSTPK